MRYALAFGFTPYPSPRYDGPGGLMISLTAQTQKLIQSWMKRGGYPTPDDIVRAALASLEQQERGGDFAPGELDQLLAVADAEIERGEVLDGEEALRQRRQRRARRTRQNNAG